MCVSLDHFWGKIVRGPAVGVSSVQFGVHIRPPKITQFHLVILYKDIFGFQVPVNYWWIFGMQILNGTHYLLEVLFSVFFTECVFGLNSLVKRALICQLHYYIDFLHIFKYAEELNDIRVLQRGEDFYLILKLAQ